MRMIDILMNISKDEWLVNGVVGLCLLDASSFPLYQRSHNRGRIATLWSNQHRHGSRKWYVAELEPKAILI